ncbi:hypothetical protein B0H10DRAFT_572233 [Mycena sp. CBHHK59/15]|nr:hypothetical protein B0H10DRAFT_572233 [Mycena sp. CBHHK59/15]
MWYALDTVIGALLIGTWVNSMLLSIEMEQAIYYYTNFPNDNWMLKCLVTTALTVDAVSALCNYASVYLYCITHWGEPTYLQNQYWPVPLYLFATGLVASLVQSFLAVRYWNLTKNKLVTPILFLLILSAVRTYILIHSFHPSSTPPNQPCTQIGGAFSSAVTIATFPTYAERSKVRIPGTIFLVSEAVTDLCIALALIFEFRRIKTNFEETKSLLNRLVVQTLQTGTAGATLALAAVIAFLIDNETNVPTGFAYCLGHIYCLTMLSNLNFRTSSKANSSKGTSSGGVSGSRANRGPTQTMDDYGGIHVYKTAVVHIDRPKSSRPDFSAPCLSAENPVDQNSAVEIEMQVNDGESYHSKNPDLFSV